MIRLLDLMQVVHSSSDSRIAAFMIGGYDPRSSDRHTAGALIVGSQVETRLSTAPGRALCRPSRNGPALPSHLLQSWRTTWLGRPANRQDPVRPQGRPWAGAVASTCSTWRAASVDLYDRQLLRAGHRSRVNVRAAGAAAAWTMSGFDGSIATSTTPVFSLIVRTAFQFFLRRQSYKVRDRRPAPTSGPSAAT